MIDLIFWFVIIIMLFVIRNEWKSTRNYIVLTLEFIFIIEIGLIYVTLTI